MNDAASLLEEIRNLMALKGENPFKVRAFEKAEAMIAERDDLEERARAGTLAELPGIGKGIADILTEYLLHGQSRVRDELAASIPPGLLELTQIPGLGAKKASQLIEELGIQSTRELEYACRENRLLKLKGFGEKIQQKILEGILFRNASQGQQRISEAFEAARKLLPVLISVAGKGRVSETGALRRRLEILSELEFLVELPSERKAADSFRAQIETAIGTFRAAEKTALPIRIHTAPSARYGSELVRTTGTSGHWRALGLTESERGPDHASEETFYEALGLPWIPPETRESGEEVALCRAGKLEAILPWDGIRGVFHNHTVHSDGAATLEEMVIAAKKLGYEYIGISDHSQSAFYAQGLKPDALLAQAREVEKVQDKHPEIRIFWGIESDILADGSLDYGPEVLKNFDFVVASIHSRFKMDRTTMTERVLEAIRNPCTRFLGHATGRLLLGRPGYELEMERVIEEAAKRDVAIEINANPARLDIDWRWGPELRKRGTHVSVNPDAHDTVGLEDTLYGIAMARKALLPSQSVVNSRSAQEVEAWLKRG